MAVKQQTTDGNGENEMTTPLRNTPEHVAGRMVNDAYDIIDLDVSTNAEIIDAVTQTATYILECTAVLSAVDATMDERRGAYRQLADAVAVLVALRRYIGFHNITGPDEIN
jgi:hypothetical protein